MNKVSSQVLTEAQAQQLVLARLRKRASELPASERGMPRDIIADPQTGQMVPMSVDDLIVNVQRWTPIGRSYTYSEIKNLGYAIG